MNKETLRNVTLEAFRRAPETQFETLKRAVAELAVERGFLNLGSSGGSRVTYHTECSYPYKIRISCRRLFGI